MIKRNLSFEQLKFRCLQCDNSIHDKHCNFNSDDHWVLREMCGGTAEILMEGTSSSIVLSFIMYILLILNINIYIYIYFLHFQPIKCNIQVLYVKALFSIKGQSFYIFSISNKDSLIIRYTFWTYRGIKTKEIYKILREY